MCGLRRRRSKAAELGVAKPAGVAELADAQDLGSCDASRGGSSPSARTTLASRQGGKLCRRARSGRSEQTRRLRQITMQISESSISGLKRELKVVIGQGELGERFATRLDEFKDQVQIRGFRKGKVPVAHLKKLYGRSVMAEVLQQAVEETSRKAIEERKERAAHQPNINLTEDKEELERVLAGQSDLAFTLSYEALPQIAVTDLAALKLERPVAEVTEEAIDKGVASLVERAIRYEVEPDRAAGTGDRLTIDFLGRSNGEEFDGGKGEDVQLIVGESRFIPGFLEGLMGGKAGEERIVNAKFPDDYPEAKLSGRDAVFTVKIKEVAKPIRPELNDEFAKTLGAESLAKLRELIAARIASEYMMYTRMKLKRQILDALDK